MKFFPLVLSRMESSLNLYRKNRKTKMNGELHRKLRFEQCEDRRMLAPLTVTSELDNTIGGDGFLTLREAINAANQLPDADEIYFASSLDSVPIVLTEGELSITNPVTIKAAIDGVTTETLDITIDAKGNDNNVNVDDGGGTRVFDIRLTAGNNQTQEVTLQDLKITGGDSDADFLFFEGTQLNIFAGGGGVLFLGASTAVNSQAKLSIIDSVISGSHVSKIPCNLALAA